MSKIKKLGFCLLIFSSLHAQSLHTEDSTSTKPFGLSEGLYIENFKIILPWVIDFNQISKYGNPRITIIKKGVAEVRWDSIFVLNGIQTNLLFFTNKNKMNKQINLSPLYGSINSLSFNKLKKNFENYTHKLGRLVQNSKSDYYYYWLVDDCHIRLGECERFKTYFGVDRIFKR